MHKEQDKNENEEINLNLLDGNTRDTRKISNFSIDVIQPDDKSDTNSDEGNYDTIKNKTRSPCRQNEYTIIKETCPLANGNAEKVEFETQASNEPIKSEESLYASPQHLYSNTNGRPKSDDKVRTELLSSYFQRSRTKTDFKLDDINENFYNPPADVRGNYFIRQSSFPIIRVLLTLVAALVLSLSAFFGTVLKLNIILSVSLSAVLFLIAFVLLLTLPIRSCACVLTLIFPSIFSVRTRIAGIIFLVLLLTIGPIIGIANKLHLATWCKNGPRNGGSGDKLWQKLFSPQNTIQEHLAKPNSLIQTNCMSMFTTVDRFCDKVFKDLQNDCNTYNGLTKDDLFVCQKRKDHFCQKVSQFEAACSLYKPKVLRMTHTVRNILTYLAPLLFLLLIRDAYMYNKSYLTIKEADNVYITQELRELDKERKSKSPSDLVLPLTRIEFQAYVLRGRLVLSKEERSRLCRGIGVFLLLSLVTACLIFTEHFIHVALLNALDGSCREIYKISTDIRLHNYIYVVLGVILTLTVLQSYMLRFRSIICDYFYPIMVTVRANHLYYRIIHDRHAFGRHMRRKIQLLAEAKRLTRRISCSSMIYNSSPRCFQVLYSKLCIRRCMICDSVTYWKTVECGRGECQAHYCYECYVDAGQKCLTCSIPASPRQSRMSMPTNM